MMTVQHEADNIKSNKFDETSTMDITTRSSIELDGSNNCSNGNRKDGKNILQRFHPLMTPWNLWRKLIFSLFLLLVIGSIFAIIMELILQQEGQWSQLTSHKCTEYCENYQECDHTMEERPTIQQPANAYTNLAYIWCGLVPIVFLRIDLSTVMYFVASSLLAIASFMFHASISSYWMNMDGSYMFTYGVVLIFHGLYVVLPTIFSWKYMTPILLILFVIMPIVRPKLGINSELMNSGLLIVVVFLVAILVLARIYMILVCGEPNRNKSTVNCPAIACRKSWQIIKILAIAFVPAIFSGIATIVWMKDMYKEWCLPSSFFQWHGVWHVLTAFASLWTWMFLDQNRLKDILSATCQDATAVDEDEVENEVIKPCNDSSVGSTDILNIEDDSISGSQVGTSETSSK